MRNTKITVKREELKIVIERIFDAPRELVWDTITDPTLIPKWWGDSTIVDKMELQVGGRWRFVSKGPDGNEFAFSGVYKEIDRPGRVVQTFNFEPIGPGHESTETAILEDLGNGTTKMTSTSVYNTIEDLDGVIRSGMEQGATATYERLAELIESAK